MKYLYSLYFLLLIGCQTHSQKCLNELSSKESFSLFAGSPLSSKYGNVSSIKVVYDSKSQKIFFVNSQFYKYHYEFCNQYLWDDITLEEFNIENYSNLATRRYLLGNINYYPALSKYVLEISPSDLMDSKQMELFYNEITSHCYFEKQLTVLVNSPHTEKLNHELNSKISFILPSEIYKNLTFQAISCSETSGVLKFINCDEDLKKVKAEDIIVITKTPLFLPFVRGIIVTEFQTPLSHLSILGQNRKIPICASKNIFKNPFFKQFENEIIHFSVDLDTFYIEKMLKLAPKNNLKPIQLQKNLTVTKLVEIHEIDKNASSFIGNKATNFGILAKLSKNSNFKVPEAGFAIPFYYYNQHIIQSKTIGLIEQLLKDSTILNNPDSLQNALKLIRNSIIEGKVDPYLLNLIDQKLKKTPLYKTFRFRSSTNAEDANGFSGAGLYDSKTVDLDNPEKSIENALKKVWASLWSFEAFMERSYFGINQEDVYMGILVHRSFPNEAVNGVAITKNIYRKNYLGFVVNAQKGDESVVQPKPGIICDQFICFPDNAGEFYSKSTDIITYSNLNQGKLVMSSTEIQNLANQLEIIKSYFYTNSKIIFKRYYDFGLDIEFKLDENTRELYIKQVRFYNN
ncbi:MAG: hypothetical protein HYR91_07505 [Flavobacteriia bacterium]|nr:hypothetical protein [Flavobacteriia bacterium]